MNTKTVIALSTVILSHFTHAEDKWRFLTLADWHSAEKYTQTNNNPDWLAEAKQQDIAAVKMLKKNYAGELIFLPGDTNGGHWDTPAFIKKFKPGLSPEDAILQAGKLCYDGMIDSFKQGGYSKLIMAVGDHELGDNPWPAGSAVSRCQPQFREAFAQSFNINPDGGAFLYQKSIGKAPSRPLGTPFEETSYAYRHKNVLFVTLDPFYQEDPNKKISEEGSVTGIIKTGQLEWLENVLSEARKDSSIKHIFVQSHLPVIHPVRKVNSSGMMMDGGTYSPFWQVMRKYKVDLYFAGEVHANTVTKDPQSNIVQIVSRGNFFNNFQTVDITDDRIEMVCYNQTAADISVNNYEVSGRLIIDKSAAKTTYSGRGELALLDLAKPMFTFSFEKDYAYTDKPIIGMVFKKNEEKIKNIRKSYCSRLFPNNGEFSSTYDALYCNIDMVDGIRGKSGKFTAKSRMSTFGMGPLYKGKSISFAAWVKTTSDANQLIINTGSIWGKELRNFINLNLNNGKPEVMVSAVHSLTADSVKLNDGHWHHVAMSMLKENSKLSDIIIYVDGKPVKASLKKNKDTPLNFNQAMRVSIGGLGYTTQTFNKLPVKPFVGELDEVTIWTRPITAKDVTRHYADETQNVKNLQSRIPKPIKN